MSRLKVLIFLLLSGCFADIYSQQTAADSLAGIVASRLREGARDTVTARFALKTAVEYFQSSTQKFLSYTSLALELGIENRDQYVIGTSYTRLGNLYWRMGIYNLALKSYNTALNEFVELNDTESIIFLHSDIGNIYYRQGMYDIAAKYYRRGLETWEKTRKDWHAASVCYINLGLVGLKLRNYDSSAVYFKRALDIRMQHDNIFFIAHANYYFGRLHQDRMQYDSALFYFNRTSEYLQTYFQNGTYTFEIAEFDFDLHSVISDIYKAQGDDKRREQLYRKMLADSVMTGTPTTAQRLYEQYADYLTSKEDYRGAISYLDKSLEVNEALNYTAARMTLLRKKAELYEKLGDRPNSLRFFKEYSLLADSVITSNINSELLNISEKLELEKQDSEMQSLVSEKERQLLVQSITNTILIAVSLIAVFFLYTFYRKYKLDNSILKFLRTLINSLRYPFYVINTRSSEIEYYNHTAEEQLHSLQKVRRKGEKLFFSGNLHTILEELKKGKTYFQQQFEEVYEDGTKKHFEVSNYPVYDHLGNIIQVIEYIRDITPLKEAERQLQEYTHELEEANRSKDRLISIIAHDLKSPFSVLLGSISILRESQDEMSYQERQKFIDNLYDAASKVYKLVENLLEWSILNAGRVSYNPAEVNMSALFAQGIQAFSLDLQNRKIAVNISCPENLTVMADLNMQRTIFRNLLANAIKFSPNDSSIEVSVKVTDTMAKVCITDHGVGMSKEDVSKLFRIDVKNTEIGEPHKAKGTGLGLIIAQEFIKLNRGVVTVQSQPGSGTTVCYTIPLSAESKSN